MYGVWLNPLHCQTGHDVSFFARHFSFLFASLRFFLSFFLFIWMAANGSRCFEDILCNSFIVVERMLKFRFDLRNG